MQETLKMVLIVFIFFSTSLPLIAFPSCDHQLVRKQIDSSSPFLSEEVSISPSSQSGFYSSGILSHNNTGDSSSSNGQLNTAKVKTATAASIAGGNLVNFANNGNKPHRRGPGRPRKELLSPTGQHPVKVVSRRGGANSRGLKGVRGGGVAGQQNHVSMQNFKNAPTFRCKISKNKFDAKIVENHTAKQSSTATEKFDKHCTKQWINNSVTTVAGSTITTSNTMANASMADVQQVANQQEVDTAGNDY